MSKLIHSGTIGLLTSETGRYGRFWLHFQSLILPPRVKLISKMSLNIAEARDEIIQEAEGEWVWFMDDDHTFQPNLLQNLLAREVPVIQPLVLSRYSPFGPVMMGPPTPDLTAQYRFALMDGIDRPGLKDCGALGAAGMLIRRNVLEAVGSPWFSRRPTDLIKVSEDITFSRRAKDKGFKLYTDMQNMMGHLNVGEVWPDLGPDGQWRTKVIFGGNTYYIPKAEPTMVIEDGKVRLSDGPPDPAGT